MNKKEYLVSGDKRVEIINRKITFSLRRNADGNVDPNTIEWDKIEFELPIKAIELGILNSLYIENEKGKKTHHIKVNGFSTDGNKLSVTPYYWTPY